MSSKCFFRTIFKTNFISSCIIFMGRKSNEEKNSNYYVKDVDLMYELILSQGLGEPTKKLIDMFLLIINNMIKKRSNGLSVDMQNDMKSEAIYTLLKNYKNYNYKKYKHQCLPYISELVKRSFAACWNEFIDKDQDFVRNVLHI